MNRHIVHVPLVLTDDQIEQAKQKAVRWNEQYPGTAVMKKFCWRDVIIGMCQTKMSEEFPNRHYPGTLPDGEGKSSPAHPLTSSPVHPHEVPE